MLVSLETGDIRSLTYPLAQLDDTEPALTPDGRTLVFLRYRGMNITSLQLLALSDQMEPRGGPRKLVAGDRVSADPAWTADGRDIVFSSGTGTISSLSLSRIAEAGGGPSPLSWVGAGAFEPTVAPQGHRLVFTQAFQDTNIWRIALDAKAAVPEKLIASTFREVFPQYSPDGKRIAFHSDRDGTVQVWTCLADGSQCVQVTNMTGTTTGTARWSPAGNSFPSIPTRAGIGRFTR
jgi:Tol biopolymer transport system component